MTEQTADVEMLEVKEADTDAGSDSTHGDKENGICEEKSVKTVTSVAKDTRTNENKIDITVMNSNHDVNEEHSDAENEDKRENQCTESKESDDVNSQPPKNHVVASGLNSETDATVEEENEVSSTNSAKEVESGTEDNICRPSPIPDRLFDEAPKSSPELIVADDGPFEVCGSTKTVCNKDEPKESSKHINNAINTEKEDLKEKESSSKVKSESKSGGKKDGESGKKKKGKTCAECGVKKKLHFKIGFQGKVHQLCSEACLKEFKTKQASAKPSPPSPSVDEKCAQCQGGVKSGEGYYPLVGEVKTVCSEDCLKKYHEDQAAPRECSECKKKIESNYSQLTWETMAFCNEDCLQKYQSFLGSHCTCCQTPVQQTSLGKYCVCFGADIRQFCSGSCLEDFKKGLKVCSFCQTDLSAVGEGFLAPVGDKGQFKDFCSQQCMERYEMMNNISKTIPEIQECSNCKKQGSFKIQIKHEDKVHSLCCDPCVSGFRCAMKVKDNMCDTCFKFFKPSAEDNFSKNSIFFDNTTKHFCTKACMTLFVLSHRKIIQCIQCKVKKYTFDMIERLDTNNTSQVFCSLNCLSLFRVNVSAASAKNIRCDNCTKNGPAQYHLTMSDGSIRNFCTYQCVLLFQNQFTTVPALTTTTTSRAVPTLKPAGLKTTPSITAPVIANVVSLAQPPRPLIPMPGKGIAPQTLVSVRPQGPSMALLSPKPQPPPPISTATLSVVSPGPGHPGVREIVVRPPVPKSVKNKSASCKPIMQTKGVNAKLQTCHKAVQTDERPMPVILPVPIPVYVPTPVHMFSRPVPCPVPFPVPIPVPIIFQSTKEYKDIINNIHPYESELLQLAEKTITDTDKNQNGPKKTPIVTQEAKEEEKQKDVPPAPETKVNASATNNVQSRLDLKVEVEEELGFKENRMKHRNKRTIDLKFKESKKPKYDDVNNVEAVDETGKQIVDMMNMNFEDTDTKLKYACGVNAWRQWVAEKQNQEKGYHPRRFKFFKTDILQLSAEELNYALGLFIKELTKPSGERYTAGALFYIVLGLQLYLHENGRIDNIFADICFHQFTDHFHEILLDYENRALAQEVPWSRIEEEYLWDSRQLGAHSPQVLLNTLIYFNTKYFKLRTTADHIGLCFEHVGRELERSRPRNGKCRAVLRYYGNYYDGVVNGDDEDTEELFQPENSNSLRCPVRLYEFYITKCPPSVVKTSSRLYLSPDKSCVPDNTIWYTSNPLPCDVITKTLQRIKLIEEINED